MRCRPKWKQPHAPSSKDQRTIKTKTEARDSQPVMIPAWVVIQELLLPPVWGALLVTWWVHLAGQKPDGTSRIDRTE